MRLFDQFIACLTEARSLNELRDAMRETVRTVGIDSFTYIRCEATRQRSSDCLADSLIITPSASSHPPIERRRLSTVVERMAGRYLPFFEEWKGLGPGTPCTALIIPVHDNVPGRVALVAFSSGNEELAETTLRPRQVELHAMSIYLHAHASRLTDTAGPPQNDVLTPRELQCLQWAARGKSRTDVGQILGLSPRTIKFHLENARRKLGATHTGQAVLKAAMLGLVTANQAQSHHSIPDSGWHLPWQRQPFPARSRTADPFRP